MTPGPGPHCPRAVRPCTWAAWRWRWTQPGAASSSSWPATAGTTLVLLDPNCRPQAITRPLDYAGRIARILRRADVVKASVEDLEYLYPGQDAEAAAAELLSAGPALVMITDGPRPAHGFGAGFQVAAEVPPVIVADTVGAGDAFGGAFLGWWTGQHLGRADLRQADAVQAAMSAAAEVAALTCARAGAEPPWAAELAGRPSWEWLARSGQGVAPSSG